MVAVASGVPTFTFEERAEMLSSRLSAVSGVSSSTSGTRVVFTVSPDAKVKVSLATAR
jgi:hypothetical protein